MNLKEESEEEEEVVFSHQSLIIIPLDTIIIAAEMSEELAKEIEKLEVVDKVDNEDDEEEEEEEDGFDDENMTKAIYKRVIALRKLQVIW